MKLGRGHAMSLHMQKSRTSSPLACVVKEYREKFMLTQEQLATDLTVEQIDETMGYIWNLIDLARSYEANTLVERLVQDLNTQLTTEDPVLLRKLAETLHLAGYVKSVVTRANEASQSLHFYQEMEQV